MPKDLISYIYIYMKRKILENGNLSDTTISLIYYIYIYIYIHIYIYTYITLSYL